MNISILSHGAHGGRGGIDLYTANVVDALSDNKKIKIINLFTKKNVGLNKSKVKKFYSYSTIKFFMIIILKLNKLLKSDLIIISHINLFPYLIIPILLKKKVVLFSYGLEIWGTNKNFIYKFLVSKIKYFICMRELTLGILKKKYSLKNKKYYLLHNCIKIQKNKIKRNKIKNIVSVARLDKEEKYKGIDETLEALNKLKNINFKYYVIGDGEDTERLKKKTIKLGLNKNVIFCGKLSDKQRDIIYDKSHIMSMPGSAKLHDRYPMRFVFLEAALYGLKILGSYPLNKKERNLEKKYRNLNFVDPQNKNEILKKIIKLNKQRKIIDHKYLSDYSFNNFKFRLNTIVKEIVNNL